MTIGSGIAVAAIWVAVAVVGYANPGDDGFATFMVSMLAFLSTWVVVSGSKD